MPLQETSGAASYDAFGGGAPVAAKYIEDFFQTWLRTGTGSSTTVTTGLNASINKSLVWTKSRSAATNHKLTDTARGVTKALSSNTTGAEVTDSQGLTAFSSTGYTIGTNTDYNNSGATYVDWQWVATPKFFDVVTYTGDGVVGKAVSHNLGSVPGFFVVKATNAPESWWCYHVSLGNTKVISLNSTAAAYTDTTAWNSQTPTSTQFFVGNGSTETNTNGVTYVAYLFAHNAGGFGLSGTDNVISCGSFTTNGSGQATVDLGYEPQWVMIKRTNSVSGWNMYDNMRGWSNGGDDQYLQANSSAAEQTFNIGHPTATGMYLAGNSADSTFIYIAIRRGPMRTPTSGTSVFGANAYSGGTANRSFSLGFVPDALLTMRRNTSNFDILQSRLTGLGYMFTNATDAEQSASTGIPAWDAPTTTLNLATATSVTGWNASGSTYVGEAFSRAPGFFDEVCYTGTGSARTVAHNLGVAPELMIVKDRSSTQGWSVYAQPLGATNALVLQTTAAVDTGTSRWNSTTPTSTVFSLGSSSFVNANTQTFVAYLFASCPGVSKVFNYTGNGSSQTINCGFTGGARFVMIKRTDSTGDWYVWDTARGIVANNDPHLSLNTTAAEVTTNDTIDTDSTGFVVNQVSATNVNVNGASYIGLAIA